jgi:predicted MFS family arabinose efflux permease
MSLLSNESTSSEISSAPPPTLARYTTLVGLGLMVTTVGQMKGSGCIGDYPIRFLLKDQLHVTPTQMATWFLWAILPWSLKPIAALITDAIPLLGSRRRNYLLIGSSLAASLWVMMALVPRTYHSLMLTAFGFNAMAVLASVVVGGLLVEGAQTHGASGRLSSLRLIVINIAMLVGGPVSGFLAARAFGWTALTGCLLFFSLVPLAFLLRERPVAPAGTSGVHPFRGIYRQLRKVLGYRNLWVCGGLFFLLQLSPGFSTPMLYYQINVLKFSPQFLGVLMFVAGGTGLVGSLIYPYFCRRFRLRTLLVLSIVCSVVTTLPYLGYVSKRTAIIIEGLGMLGATLAQLPLLDLAARATPKGSEALGYSVMIAFWNIGISVSDVLGSYLYDHFQLTFKNLVWVNAGSTALVLLAIPFLPGYLVNRTEGGLPTRP